MTLDNIGLFLGGALAGAIAVFLLVSIVGFFLSMLDNPEDDHHAR
jgi:hypothetical protein